jgi:cold shock CspA family protein
MAGEVVQGSVKTFDVDRGLGILETLDGEHLAFHATAIADGSRKIAVGERVVARRAPTHGGTFEAVSITPAAGAADERSPSSLMT